MSMKVNSKPLSKYLGEEIQGRVQDFINRAGKAALYKLFLDRGLLLFRDQDLSGEDQVAFCQMFGPVSHRGANMKKDANFSHVSNARPDGVIGFGELQFHADHCFYEWPLKAISLYAIQVPPTGGDTLFSHAGVAYDRLPEETKARITNMRGLHLYDFAGNKIDDYAGTYHGRFQEDKVNPATSVRWEHPLAWTHPETGRKLIFVNRSSTAKIYGVSPEEGDQLLEHLAGHIDDPELIYRHKWRTGDLLLWDNRILQHARTEFDSKSPRTMRRVPLAEDCPAAVAAA